MTSGQPPNSSAEIDLGEILLRLWARRWLLLVFVVVFTSLGIAAAFLITPKYSATAVMVPAGADKDGMSSLGSALGQLGGLASLAGVRVDGGDTQTQEALAVLQSREFTEAYIRDNALLPELFASEWDAAGKRWRKAPPTLARAYKYFNAVRSIEREKDSGLVKLAIVWRDRERGAQWANGLIDRLNAEMRSRAIARSESSLSYLEKELAGTATLETRQAISRLIESQINHRMFANTSHEYSFRVVDRALPADAQDPASPNKPLLVIGGFLVGLLLGTCYVLAAAALRGIRGRVART